MQRSDLFGPLGTAFTALLFIGLLTGCRQSAPPTPPLQAWAHWEALLPLHPSHYMVADLDRQLASLTRQRARLLAQPALTLPAGEVTHEAASLPALQAPSAPTEPPTVVILRTQCCRAATGAGLPLATGLFAPKTPVE